MESVKIISDKIQIKRNCEQRVKDIEDTQWKISKKYYEKLSEIDEFLISLSADGKKSYSNEEKATILDNAVNKSTSLKTKYIEDMSIVNEIILHNEEISNKMDSSCLHEVVLRYGNLDCCLICNKSHCNEHSEIIDITSYIDYLDEDNISEVIEYARNCYIYYANKYPEFSNEEICSLVWYSFDNNFGEFKSNNDTFRR